MLDIIDKLINFYSKPLLDISKKIIKINISDINNIDFENYNVYNIIKELILFKNEIKKTIYKNKLVSLNIVNKIIYIFFFNFDILEREMLIDTIYLYNNNNDELDETYNLIIDCYRKNEKLNIKVNYDINDNQKIKNFINLLEKKNIEDETCIFLYLFKNIEYFHNILNFYKNKEIDDILIYILNNISIDYIYELFSIKKKDIIDINETCSVCLENNNLSKSIILLCGHFYHLNCFLKNYIMAYNQNCTICRKIFIKI